MANPLKSPKIPMIVVASLKVAVGPMRSLSRPHGIRNSTRVRIHIEKMKPAWVSESPISNFISETRGE